MMSADTFRDERDAEDLARGLNSYSITRQCGPDAGRVSTYRSERIFAERIFASEPARALDDGREAFDQFERLTVSGLRDRLLGEQDDSPGARVAPSL